MGHRVGVEIHHPAQSTIGRFELPRDLAYVGHISFADGFVYITTTERGALTVLIAADGRVVGDLRIPGMADHVLDASCTSDESDAEFVALVPVHCGGGDQISPARLWERQGPSLVPSSVSVDCFCIL